MSIRQLPSPRWTIPGNSGVVAAGYYVYTYQPGTSTPKATYTDHTGSTPNTNPIVLDARGEANIWWDGQYKVLVYTGDKDAGGVLVWSQDNYGEGTSSVLQGNFNLVLNGSFEQDTNGDDLPDDWTIVEYTDGTVERDSIEQIHGAYSLKFLSVGTGGGYADSTLFEVQEARALPISFAIKSSIATVHNQVDVVWHNAAGAVISTSTIHDDDTTNPTDWTTYNYSSTPPANARFAKVRLFGCKDDNATSGSVWFDNVVADAAAAGLFPNVNANVTASDEELNILDGATIVGWNLGIAEYYGKNKDVSAQDPSLRDVKLSSDGTKMYIVGATNGDVHQYALSTAWDVSTAAYSGKSKSVVDQEAGPIGVEFGNDGTKMYVIGTSSRAVHQYALSTAWDVSTATYEEKSKSVVDQDTVPVGVVFSSDGTKMYVSGTTNDTVYQYALSTAWDVSTATYANKSADVSALETLPRVAFSSDGTKMYIVGATNDTVYQYALSTAWDVSTAAYEEKSKSVAAQDTAPAGVTFSADGTKMYVSGSANLTVYQYNTGFIMPA